MDNSVYRDLDVVPDGIPDDIRDGTVDSNPDGDTHGLLEGEHKDPHDQLPAPVPNPIFYNSSIIENDVPLIDGKFTLGIDCVALLKPDENDPAYAISKTPNELALFLHLPTLLPIPTLVTIKIKAIHTCGPIPRKDGLCLTALWGLEGWFAEQYQAYNKRVETKRWENDSQAYDTADPDFMLTLFIKRASKKTGAREPVVRA
jgi:hypothetical protein